MSGSLTRPDWAADIKDLARRLGILERRLTPTPTPAGPLVPAGGEDSGWVLPAQLKIVGQFIVDGNSLIPFLAGDVEVSGDLTVYDQLHVNGGAENTFTGSVQIGGALEVLTGYVRTAGLILISPDNSWWLLHVGDDGVVWTEDIGP